MNEKSIQIYGFRWIVLLLFMFVNITVQILWVSYATVTSVAVAYYNVEEIMIFLLAAIFMIVYIPVTFLSSWIIDKYDFKVGAGIGAMFQGIFGFLRFIAGPNFMLVLIFQVGIAFGQPFIMNAITKLSANWFPESERTSATGLGMIAMFLGIALGMFIPPLIVASFNFQTMVLVFGVLSLISGILFVIFAKNKPPTPPSSIISGDKVLMVAGMKQLFKNKNFLILFVVFFLGLGIFNMITIYIESIVLPRGFNSVYAGIFGGLMLIGGIAGCVVMSTLSDKYKKRKILLITSVLIATISLFVISFAQDGTILLLFAFLFGFGLLSASPVALEYAVDITSPVPEATSNGMLLMIGQISGIIFILGFEGFTTSTGDYFPALILQSFFLLIGLIIVCFLKEVKK